MKKFLCMMMAVLMVLAMAACGGEPANNGGNDTPDATTVKIGGIGPLTGAYANYGLSEKNGAELAVKEINEAGGIAGKQIELSYQDSQGESESAVNAYWTGAWRFPSAAFSPVRMPPLLPLPVMMMSC